MSSNCTTKRYYTLGSTVVAVRDSAGSGSLSYLLGDQLGSTTTAVNASTGATQTQRFLPYGAPRSGAVTATDRGWIGQTKDTSTGLQYLNARYYDPQIGRFTATDPLRDLTRPKSLDAYGYGLGSPTSLTDPSGLMVPIGEGRDRQGAYHHRWSYRYGKDPYQPTRLRLPGVEHQWSGITDAGVILSRQVNSAYPLDPVSDRELARLFVESRMDPRMFTGPGGNCSQVGVDGCRRKGTLITWAQMNQALDDARALAQAGVANGPVGRAAGWLWQHLGASASGCIGPCVSVTLNNGHLTTAVSGVGLMTPGASATYHSTPLDQQHSGAYGGMYALGVGVGVSTTGDGDLNFSVPRVPSLGVAAETPCYGLCLSVDLFGWWSFE